MTITAEALLTIKDRVQIGMMLLKDIVETRLHVTDIAHGMFDAELRLGLFYALKKEFPTNAAECNTEEIDRQLDIFKAKAADSSVDQQRERLLIAALGAYDRSFEMKPRGPSQQERLMAERRKEFIAKQQPHAEGTVKEIAAKYGLSLSEVRRRKAAGVPFDKEL